jgi:hypothetical protein
MSGFKRFALIETLFKFGNDYKKKQRILSVLDKYPEMESPRMLEFMEEFITASRYQEGDK